MYQTIFASCFSLLFLLISGLFVAQEKGMLVLERQISFSKLMASVDLEVYRLSFR